MPDPSLNKEEFHSALENAVRRRQEVYSNYFCLHFRWSNDETGAERDGASFAELVKLLGFSEPENYIIPATDSTPGFELRDRISRLFRKALNSSGRSVIALHYSGYAEPNDSGELVLTTTFNGKPKKIAANSFLFDITTDLLIPFENAVDTVVILDCCHSFLATRNANPEARIVEILSAGRDAQDPIAFGAGKTNSFTSKLLMEVRHRAQRGEKFAEMASVIETLQRTSRVKKPAYAAKVGLGSICLPLTTSSAMVDVSRAADGLLATFSVHVSSDFTARELEDLVEWIESLPKTKHSSLKLESVKQTGSMLFIFECDIVGFRRICDLPGVQLICENLPVDFSWLQGPKLRNLPTNTGENRAPSESSQAPASFVSHSRRKSSLR